MKQKLMMKYFFVSIFLVVIAVYLFGLSAAAANADPPDATPSPAMNIITSRQAYQTPEPDQPDGRLLQETPLPAEAEELPAMVQGQYTFYAIADATVLQGYPSNNFGDTSDMWAGYDDYLDPDGRIVRSLVKFDISSLPTDEAITTATLRVRLVSSWDFPDTSRTITTYRIIEDWSEDNVNWNNKPGYGSADGSQFIDSNDMDWHEFDVTDLVSDWHNNIHPNDGIMLRGPEYSGSDSSWRGFSTKEGSYRPQLVVVTDPPPDPPPAAPTNLVATAVSQHQIDLTWQDNSSDESAFHIERSPNGSTGWTEIDSVGANVTSYSDVGLDCDTTYYYRVRAYRDSDGQYSDYSNVDSATTFAGCVPPIPILSSPANGSRTYDSTPAFMWSDDPEATSYRLQVDNNAGFGSPEINQVTASASYTPSTPLALDVYYWRVRGINASGESDWSGIWNFTLSADSVSLPFYDGFESGILETGWYTSTTAEGRVRISSSYPYTGSYSLLLDDGLINFTYSYAAAELMVDLSGRSEVELSFWWREFGDENDPGDGVFISDDYGIAWHRVLSFNDGTSDFRNDIVDIDAAAAADGLTLNDHFLIKFQFYDNLPIPLDGYAIDGVSITSETRNVYLPLVLRLP